jgi:hypothetical protein
MRRANVSPCSVASRIRSRPLACLIDAEDANLEIHGDAVSSDSDARDLYIPA